MDNHLTNHDNERETPKYQNTYRLNAYNPFKIDPVDKIVKTIMITKLEDISYNAVECLKLCELVATEIREKIKTLNFDSLLNIHSEILSLVKHYNLRLLIGRSRGSFFV